MKTDKTSIYDLFQTHRRYVVPIFQRGYVWGQEGQWRPLWDDLVAQAAATARHSAHPAAGVHKHFLGAVVLNLTQTALSQVPVVEIIDGQQRLTTIQVLLAALRDATRTLDDPYVKADLNRLTANQEPLAHPDDQFKVWPTSAIQDHVRNIMTLGSPEALEALYSQSHKFRYKKWDPPRPPLLEAYLFFSAQIRAFISGTDDDLPIELEELSPEQRALKIVEALVRDIQLVTIQLEQEDDAQVIFETLNARGEPLTPSDLVRNFIFLSATRQGKDTSSLYQDRWRKFEEEPPGRPFWKQDERQGRLRRSRMDLFLFHYVTFMTGQELKIGHLYQEFREWWDSVDDRGIESELDEMNAHSDTYKLLLEPDRSTTFGQSAERIRILDTTTAYPLILWVANELGTDHPEFVKIVQSIEAYLVRRMVCGYNQKAYNRVFLEHLRHLRDSSAPLDSMVVRTLLGASQAESVRWPTDAEFRNHLVGDETYKTLGPRRTGMLLDAIDRAHQGAYREKVDVISKLTVEHVLPQKGTELDWPLEMKLGESLGEARARRLSSLQQLGNLTLLTQELNSAVSNGPFTEKRPEIAVQSALALNTYFQAETPWGEEQIKARGEKLADMALSIWPGPPA